MLERELKLHVPAAARAAVEANMRTLGAREQRLHARYFDTRFRELAQAGVTVRLRQEGDQWVQTAKAPGPDAISHIELNHYRPDGTLDLAVYAGTVLEPVLANLRRPLRVRYETEITRLKLVHKTADPTATVELAYDSGVVRAGALSLQVCELEFELLDGPPSAIFRAAKGWQQRHGLIVDLRSKSERGDLLAQHASNDGLYRNRRTAPAPGPMPADGLRIDPTGQGLLKPARAAAINLAPDMTPQQAYAACMASCLESIIRNATLLAGVDNARADDTLKRRYVHQLRVSMRRLRTCWKFFAKWIVIPAQARQLARFFRHLGVTSDYHVLRFEIAPRLAEAGMPPLPLPIAAQEAGRDPRAQAADPAFQDCLMSLLAHQIETSEEAAGAAPSRPVRYTRRRLKSPARDLGSLLAMRLQKWLRGVCREGRAFGELPQEAQHDLRKKLKCLRYSMEFSESVLPPEQVEHIRHLLEPIQHSMGDLNDLYNAQAYYEAAARKQPAALFALGWLKASQEHLKHQVQAALDRLETEARTAG